MGIHPSVHAESIPLDRNVDIITDVELPTSTYVREEFIAINSEWRLVGMSKGLRVWETTLPIRTRSLFYHRPPSGMEVHRRPHGRTATKLPLENAAMWKRPLGILGETLCVFLDQFPTESLKNGNILCIIPLRAIEKEF
jgi:hypothetical protein